MRAATLIFARMDSRRLPGKALMPLAGRAMLDHVVARARLAPLPVIVATSERALDDPIAERAQALQVPVYRGHAEDVTARALACSVAHGLDAIIRVSGDSPFLPPEVIGSILDAYRAAPACELATNLFPRTFPKGASAELLPVPLIKRLMFETDDPEDHEHVTRYAYSHPEKFVVKNVALDPPATDVVLTVDTPEDYRRACDLFAAGIDASTPFDRLLATARALAAHSPDLPKHGTDRARHE